MEILSKYGKDELARLETLLCSIEIESGQSGAAMCDPLKMASTLGSLHAKAMLARRSLRQVKHEITETAIRDSD